MREEGSGTMFGKFIVYMIRIPESFIWMWRCMSAILTLRRLRQEGVLRIQGNLELLK